MASFEEQTDWVISVPLPQAIRTAAAEVAAQVSAQVSTQVSAQVNAQIAARVQRNLLAVGAACSYLHMQQYETDLTGGDCWNPALQLVEDVADLPVVGFGRLECRPFAPGEESVVLPLEAQVDRMGYLGVELDPLDTGEMSAPRLLGFLPAYDLADPQERLHRSDLHSLDALIDYLFKRETLKQLIDSSFPEVQQYLPAEQRPQGEAQLLRVAAGKPTRWGVEGGRVLLATLAGGTDREPAGMAVRETLGDAAELEVQNLARKLLKELERVCQDALGDDL